MAAKATRIDMDRVLTMLRAGHPLDAIARVLNTTPGNIRLSAKALGRELDGEPEGELRARWERLIPGMKAAIVREILRDQT